MFYVSGPCVYSDVSLVGVLFKSRVMGFQFFVAPLNVPVRNTLGPGGSNVEPTLVLL